MTMNRFMKNTALVLSSITLMAVIIPSGAVVFASSSSNVENVDTNTRNKVLKDVTNELIRISVEHGFGVDLVNLSDFEKEIVLNEFYVQMPETRNPVVAVLGAIAAVIAIGKYGYDAGRYGAMRLSDSGVVTRGTYKNYPALYPAVTATFGVMVGLGFDDWMRGR
ncbi:MAG: hypothetical protein LBT37_03785 [Lactobacillaceae bacterium]|nr:hypothetical protein [Lactobacillaceae bacterium]